MTTTFKLELVFDNNFKVMLIVCESLLDHFGNRSRKRKPNHIGPTAAACSLVDSTPEGEVGGFESRQLVVARTLPRNDDPQRMFEGGTLPCET